MKKLEYKYFNNSEEIEDYMKKAMTYTPESVKVYNDFEYHLSSSLSCQKVDQKTL